MSQQSTPGDFTMPDTTGAGSTDLNTLFGVSQAVGATPIVLHGRIPVGAATRGESFDRPRAGLVQPMVSQTDAQGHTVQGVLNSFYGMDPDALANLQERLYAGRFYSSSYYTKNGKKPLLGSADDDTFAAFKKAVVQAGRSGQPLDDVLDTAASAAAAGDVSGQKNPVQFTNPDDLRAALDTVGPNVIGRRPDPSVYDNFVAGYHELESAAANQSDSGGNVTAPPSPSAAAEQYLRRTFPADAYRSGYVDAFDAFRQMISGGK